MEKKMKLIIESSVGLATPVTVECEPTEAVGTLLSKAAATQGVTDTESYALSLNGKILDNKRRVKEYGLKDGDTLQIVPFHRTVGNSSFSLSFSAAQNGLPPHLINRLVTEAKIIRVRRLPVRMDLHNPLHWTMRVRGSGLWRGQDSTVEVRLSRRYPRVMPRIVWVTRLIPKHPNIFPETTGWVCISSLDPRNWRPTRTLASIYDDLIYVMDHPNWEHRRPVRDPVPRPRPPLINRQGRGIIRRAMDVLRG